jgi:hypothetical protein
MSRLFPHQNLDSTLEDTGEWPWFSIDVTPSDSRIDDLTKESLFGEVRFRDRVSKTSTGAVSSYTMQLAFPGDLRSETILESVRAMTAQIPVLMIQARGARFEERLRKIAEAYVIDDPLDDAYLALHEQQLQARQRLLKLMPMLEAKHVAKFAGHENKNTAQTASRWKTAGKIFSVPVSGTERYPEFQFKAGLPKPIIEELIQILNPRIEWDLAFWFASANGWLDGAAPMSMIDEQPERVLNAARHANDQISD